MVAILPPPVVHPTDPLAVLAQPPTPPASAASSATTVVGVGTAGLRSPSPDGTGDVSAELPRGGLCCSTQSQRRARAIFPRRRSPSTGRADLSASLHSFEGNLADYGWLGSGLHAPGPEPTLNLGSVAGSPSAHGERGGPLGGAGGTPRTTSSMGFRRHRLSRLRSSTLGGWGGREGREGCPERSDRPSGERSSATLLVQEGSAYLEELAAHPLVAPQPLGPQITVKTLPYAELARRRAASAFSLLLGWSARSPPRGRRRWPRSPLPRTRLCGRPHEAPPQVHDLRPAVADPHPQGRRGGGARSSARTPPDVRLARNPNGEGWDLPSTYRLWRVLDQAEGCP